jgi:sucrose-6-phosphatase
VREAIAEHDLPVPDVVIGDVGTSIFIVTHGPLGAHGGLAAGDRPTGRASDPIDWPSSSPTFAVLRLQEPEKQAPFKLSYYAPFDADPDGTQIADGAPVWMGSGCAPASIWSIDEAAASDCWTCCQNGATKYHAVDFLMRYLGHD